jgi:nucleoside-diphosphate-sugar epimerase
VQTVVLTGTASPLGQRVGALLSCDRDVVRVVAVGDEVVGLSTELKRDFEGADVLVHLHESAAATRNVLEAAGAAGVAHVVLLSSATVYGASPANPVPLTEAAPLRPNPGVRLAVEAAERERLAAEWRDLHPGATVSVLRAAAQVAEDGDDWLERALRAAGRGAPAAADPPTQFVHVDDLAAAVDLARRRRLDGPYNVAPDGWLDGEARRALAGVPRVRVPERVRRLADWRWRLGLAKVPPALVAYARHPWVVANGKLRAEGWQPAFSNEEAFVAGHPPTPWATVSPHRRQQLAFGAVAAGAVAAAGTAAVVTQAIRRRQRQRRT